MKTFIKFLIFVTAIAFGTAFIVKAFVAHAAVVMS